MPKPIQNVFQSILTLPTIMTIITMALTAGAIVWGYFLDWGPLIIPLGFVTSVSGLYLFAWVRQYEARRGIPQNRLQQTLTSWLAGNEWYVKELPNDNAEFGIQVEFGTDDHCYVYQRQCH